MLLKYGCKSTEKIRAHQTMGPIFCLLAGVYYPFISLIRRLLAKGRTAK